MTDVDEENLNPLRIHKEAWNQKDLLEGIVQRYLTVRAHTGGLWPTWEVESDQLDENLEELNGYLERLGWMARLRRGDTNQLTTLPLPHRQFPGSRIHLYMWTASLITLILSAVRWMDTGRPEYGWFSDSVYVDALLGFALPILFSLLLASFIQVRISAKFGVRSGHILPIPDPSVIIWLFSGLSTSFFIWPFGIFFIPTLPRMDARPWTDRISLAWASISAPIVMIVSGFVFWTLGFALTTDSYLVTEEPYRANAPFLFELLAAFVPISTENLDWSHPFFFAAAFLTLVGWLLMLPVPTFPGGRLLVARMGLEEARSSGTQILMFMILITAAFFIFNAFNGFTIWIPILSVIIPLLLFMGSDVRIPMMLDGDRPLDEDTHRRLGIILFAAILLALPPEFPIEPIERWDAEATYSFESDSYAELSDQWNASAYITLTNPSMLDYSYSVSQEILGDSLWTSELSCVSQGCEGILKPDESVSIELLFNHENTTHQPSFVEYEVEIRFDEAHSYVERSTILPNINASLGTEWYHVRSIDSVHACLDVHVEKGQSANISFPDLGDEWLPYLWLEGQAGLTQTLTSEDTKICLDGVDQALPLNVQSMIRNLTLGNSSFVVNYDPTWDHIVSSSEGWLIDQHQPWGAPFDANGTMYQENTTSCKESYRLLPPGSEDLNWTWDLSILDDFKVPASISEGQRLKVKFGEDTYVFCNQDDYTTTKFIVQEGPDLILHHNEEAIRLWDVPMTADSSQLELTLFNSNEDEVVFRHAAFGNVEWDLSALPNTLNSGWNNFSLMVPNSEVNTYQLTHQDGAILITFGAYMEVES
ncbi:MAG: hypothetical protein CMA67_06400 [Euryarchaeota archaeon]|nr:hypothetical protein [Euryarchaeota archaeon]